MTPILQSLKRIFSFSERFNPKRDLAIALVVKILFIIALIYWHKAQEKPKIEQRYSILFSK